MIPPVEPQIFQFESCRIDLRGRELWIGDERVQLPIIALDCLVYLIEHRERPVGRDELISAVWGRAQVSESTLAHTIVRLRQALQDSGVEQRSIRTVPRLGYRWVGELQVVAEAPPDFSSSPDVVSLAQDDRAVGKEQHAGERGILPSEGEKTAVALHRRRWRRARVVLPTLLTFALLVLGYVLYDGHSRGLVRPLPAEPVPPQLGLVLPVDVEASEEWAWLRLGLMELLAGRLREAGIPTVPSETILALSGGAQTGSEPFTGVEFERAVQIRARISRNGDGWLLRLTLNTPGGGIVTLDPPISGRDPAEVARAGAGRLLVYWGKHGPEHAESRDDLDVLFARVQSAILTDQLGEARALINQAPDHLREQPEMVSMAAWLDCRENPDQVCADRLQALLQEIPEEDIETRALTMRRHSKVLVRQGRADEGFAELEEAIDLMLQQDDKRALVTAYLDRGWMRLFRAQLEEAADDIRKARVLAEGSADIASMAEADMNLAQVEIALGHPASAERLATRAAGVQKRIERLQGLVLSIFNASEARRYLLEHEAALAALDEFHAVESRVQDAQLIGLMKLSRADALIDLGRLKEAQILAEDVHAKPMSSDSLKFTAQLLRLKIALARADYAQASTLADELPASRFEVFTVNDEDGTQAWRLTVLAYLGVGRTESAAKALDGMRAEVERRGRRLWHATYLQEVESEYAWQTGDSGLAIRYCESALAAAGQHEVPSMQVAVAARCIPKYIDVGQMTRASELAGRVSQWSETDMSAALAQARFHRAIGNDDAAENILLRAIELAGERHIDERK